MNSVDRLIHRLEDDHEALKALAKQYQSNKSMALQYNSIKSVIANVIALQRSLNTLSLALVAAHPSLRK